jgi:hypothetical protein
MGLGSGIRYPRSGIRKKPIPDPGSRGQKVTWSQILGPDLQHNKFSLPGVFGHLSLFNDESTYFHVKSEKSLKAGMN